VSDPHQGPLITRKEAKEWGLKRYFEGSCCARGHLAERRVVNRECVECRKLNRTSACPKNKEKINKKAREKYKENRDYHLKKAKKWREENQDRKKEYSKGWEEKNKHKRKMYKQKRRSAEANAEGEFKPEDILRIFDLQRGRCGICSKKKELKEMHVDHIEPLSRGGSNWPRNLQMLCKKCNLSKASKDQIDFMRERGRLL
jgi:5-methylcytosine-specific restriction endonuclease McrA